MAHGDDVGLVCPPRLAPTQVVIVPIFKSAEQRETVLQAAGGIRETLRSRGIRTHLDDRDGMKPGAKYYDWESRGVPVRLEVGPRDVEKQHAMLARRTGGKAPVPLDGIANSVLAALDEIQVSLLEASRARREANSIRGVTKEQLLEIMSGAGGFAYGGFCGNDACETAIKEATKATIRVLPDEEFRSDPPPSSCVWCGEKSVSEAVWARAY
jgi:prolyl-tRNA synthetase